MTKNCLVLGANGFEGSHLVDALLARGFYVRAFDEFTAGKKENLMHPQEQLDIFSGNFMNSKDIDRAMKDIDFVFHFAYIGSPSVAANDPKFDIENNVIGTINLLDACIKHKIQRIIYRSSGGAIYGDIQNGYANENHRVNPIAPYGINKLCVEQYLAYYKYRYHLDYISYRISNPYGERQSTEGDYGVIPILLKKVLQDESIDVYGNSVRDYIYIKDVTELIVSSFDTQHIYNVYNLGSGVETSLLEVLGVIEAVTGIIPKINQLEKREFDVDRIMLDVSRIRKEFSFTSKVTFVDGVRTTYKDILKIVEQ
jgi:UDP-glucose 4-epimerase